MTMTATAVPETSLPIPASAKAPTSAESVDFNRSQQALELVDAVERTLDTSHNLVVIQLLNNADQLQSQLSSGNLKASEVSLLVENLIKRPLRRVAGLLASAKKVNQEVRSKVSVGT